MKEVKLSGGQGGPIGVSSIPIPQIIDLGGDKDLIGRVVEKVVDKTLIKRGRLHKGRGNFD